MTGARNKGKWKVEEVPGQKNNRQGEWCMTIYVVRQVQVLEAEEVKKR